STSEGIRRLRLDAQLHGLGLRCSDASYRHGAPLSTGQHTHGVGSWPQDQPLELTTAMAAVEREKAIDELVSPGWPSPGRPQSQYSSEGFVPPNEPIVFRYLAPGSTSEGHQTVLVFAAGEYDRLASEVANPELRSRLEDKAKELRQLVSR